MRSLWPFRVLILAVFFAETLAGNSLGQEVENSSIGRWSRRVTIPARPPLPAVVVSEFFTHGAFDLAGPSGLRVEDSRGQLVPWRVLQAGPGDFCRVAFQTVPGQSSFVIRYGRDVGPVASPAWTAQAGLLLETRRGRAGDLGDVASVRAMFEAGRSFGRDYVPHVFHRVNPIRPDGEPFTSLYQGNLEIPAGGRYQFFTSSQDCSFLSIDGVVVVAAPGRHGPVGDARHKGEVTLNTGLHRFEYLHAAAGSEACMVAAWQPPGAAAPEPIPPEAFGSALISRLPAIGPFREESDRRAPDFQVAIVGEVTLDEGEPLIRARFRAATAGSRARWDFGPGQSATGADVTHVFLRPGLSVVALSVPGDPSWMTATNRVEIDRALVADDPQAAPPDTLAAYLPILARLDPRTLDEHAVLQLARAFLEADQPASAAEVARGWLDAGQAPSEGNDTAVLELARRVGPLLRDRLGEPGAAVDLWLAAARRVRQGVAQAECQIAAAEILIEDQLQADEAAPWLERAADRLSEQDDPTVLSALNRVQGRWYARQGDRTAAREAYRRAEAFQERVDGRSTRERAARRGASSRSAEAFLREGDLHRALETLRQWSVESPGDLLDGTLPVLLAGHGIARKSHDRVIALADDVLAVAPESPFADRLLLIAARSEEARDQADRARARYQALLTDYPGSPLVAEAKAALDRLSGETRTEGEKP